MDTSHDRGMSFDNRARALMLGSVLFVAGFAIASGCGGDDASTNDTSGNDSGSPADATTSDGPTSSDASTDGAIDAKPHVVFVTSGAFSGDLIDVATAIAADAGASTSGLDAGDGDGGGSTYVLAADSICMHYANIAGLPGNFRAIIAAGSDAPLAGVTDADGPWARMDGVPVAASAADLRAFRWRSAVDITEKGVTLPDSQSTGSVWAVTSVAANATKSCNGWTSASHSDDGVVGCYDGTGLFASSETYSRCDGANSLYCAQVGSGGSATEVVTAPAGSKLGFVAYGVLPPSLALPDAGVLSSSPPDAGDAVHSVGDAICSQNAAQSGLSGKYHAWISASDSSAAQYFSSLGMTGPWYRRDGMEIASSLADLTTNGAQSPLTVQADGGALYDDEIVLTGTFADGGYSGYNCGDFTAPGGSGSANEVLVGEANLQRSSWTDFEVSYCSFGQPVGIYCFEE